jgi:drug/metabolite transporter (DMT)-like permease
MSNWDFPLVIKTTLALIAFAGNSVLCRLALENSSIDPATFTSIRILSGAFALLCILYFLQKPQKSANALNSGSSASVWKFANSDWLSGLALFVYAAAFSFAYINLPAGTGALILFASVQITMLGTNIFKGMRLSYLQWGGFLLAIIGLVYLLFPGISSPSLSGSLLMIASGIAWGVYSLKGKAVTKPTQATTENFLRSLPLCIGLSLLFMAQLDVSTKGIVLAIVSGAITSGVGYAIWYSVLPSLKAASAATLQLTVPVIATIGGAIWIAEGISLRLVVASLSILGGVAMVVLTKSKSA